MEKKHTILIVDDERYNIKVLTEFLKADYQIMAAKSGEQALKTLSGKRLPDLILLDILMEDMDGYEVCRRIKADESTQHIPVIFVTAVSEAMDSARAFELGAVDYVMKPYNPVTVKARVNTHITLNNSLQELTDALKKVKKLTGLLPICSSCKKIRDDKGYWNQVETYVQETTGATFSHGMCPDCNDELYGDKDWYQKMKKEKGRDET